MRSDPRTRHRAAVTLALAILLGAAPAYAAPRDFTPEIRALFAVAACGAPATAEYDAAAVAAHCKELARPVAAWKANWRDKAAPFFQALLGAKSPATVVYPFGGGDLSTLLVVYPDATEYTTLSLEGMGDPRPLAALGPRRLAPELLRLRQTIGPNLGWAWNTTIQLSIDSSATGAGIPNILALTLVALDANGYEPIEARFFKLGAQGAVVYLEPADVDAWDAGAAARRSGRKVTNAVQEGAFNNIELVFRKKGDPAAPKKTFRHITGDLSDAALAKTAGPLDYLAARRDVAAMTKAASYLLWRDPFSKLRGYLLGAMRHMISDDTGIPPRFSGPAGFTTEVWGSYSGPFFQWARGPVADEMVKLFRGNTRPMPFRFGYYDAAKRPVLMLVRK